MPKSYRHEIIAGCSLIFAPPLESGVPIEAMMEMIKFQPKGSVLDTDMARIHGAIMVCGTRAALDALRRDDVTLEKAKALEMALPASISPEMRHWAIWGEQGLSSQAIFRHLTKLKIPGVRPPRDGEEPAYPRDVNDLGRCIRLLEEVPELQGRIGEMAEVSQRWKALAAVWNDLVEAHRVDPELGHLRDLLDKALASKPETAWDEPAARRP